MCDVIVSKKSLLIEEVHSYLLKTDENEIEIK